MRKRPFALLACMFLVGIFLGKTGAVPILGIGLAVYLYAAPWKERGVRLIALAVGMPLVLLLGDMRIKQQELFRDRYLTQIEDGQTIRLVGKIDYVEEKPHCFYYYLTDCFLSLSNEAVPCNDVLAYVSSDDYSVGQILRVKGTISLFDDASNEGQFDARAFYRSRKIDLGVWADAIECVGGRPDDYRSRMQTFRERLCVPLKRYANDGGVLSAMLLGERSNLDSEIKSLYQQAGIAHILAISGLHVSLLGMSLYRLLRRRFGIPYAAAAAAVSIFLSVYTVMTGNAVSARRATGMLVIYLLADITGRAYDMLSALGCMVVLLLWENPFLIENSGFAFSVAAVLGIGVAQELILEYVWAQQSEDERTYLWLRKRAQGVLISVLLQLFTLPLVAYYNYEIPIYAVLINIPVLAFVPGVLGLAVLGIVLGQFAFTQQLSMLVCRGSGIILDFYQWLCDMFLKLPGAQWITGKPSVIRIILYYAMLGVLCCLWLYRIRRNTMEKGKRFKSFLGYGIVVVSLFFILLGRTRDGFEMDILDVGQGDAIYLCTSDGISLMIDGGSTDVKKVGAYRILPFLKSKAVQKVSYWFVSHADEDHISGLVEVMESGYHIENLVFAEAQREAEKVGYLVALAGKYEINVCYMKPGDAVRTGSAIMECIYPYADIGSEDVNDRCLVLRYQDKYMSGFFGGDISSEVEAALIREQRIDKTTFLKASHHGSKYSNSAEFLWALSPQIAVASAGKNNRYGHPGIETIERIHECGSEFYCTIECGQISAYVKDNQLVWKAHKIEFDN